LIVVAPAQVFSNREHFTMTAITHPRLEMTLDMAELLMDTGVRLAFEAADTAKRLTARRRKSAATLRPGAATPLWNALASELASELRAYGHKARLARVMGVSRQTVHAWCTGRSRMPDAERTLQLMAWLLARRKKQEPL
jgi:transcriptional regulator with XRE-family HTH domain